MEQNNTTIKNYLTMSLIDKDDINEWDLLLNLPFHANNFTVQGFCRENFILAQIIYCQ